MITALAMIGALPGFLVFNYLRGTIFLGIAALILWAFRLPSSRCS